MHEALSPQATRWVDERLGRMSTDQKLGQLLHPAWQASAGADGFARQVLSVCEPGGVFLFPGTCDQFRQTTAGLQDACSTPVVVSSDLENGAGRMLSDATAFADPMALGAADRQDLARAMGEATAREGRACGVHWTFSPVCDLNLNPHNPVVCTRSLGDDPARVSRFIDPLIRAIQANGMCATAKHFPGDGLDDRDQHICTTINPLRLDQWRRLSGRVFQAAVDAGVGAVMIGHVSLPAVDPGDGTNLQSAPPATLSRRLLDGLLRADLGFEGVVITDAMNMAGVTNWGDRSEIVVRAVNAGCDMILFSFVEQDFAILQRAVAEGRLSMERVDQAARRILTLKAKLGLHEEPGPRVDAGDTAAHAAAARELAEAALTLVHGSADAVPVPIEGKRLLSLHIRGDAKYQVDGVDELLRARGAEVVRMTEADEPGLGLRVDAYDAVLVHLVFGPSWMTGRIRLADNYNRGLVTIVQQRHPHTIFISYGSPYHGYDLPQAPVLLNAYGPAPSVQQAVVRWLAGEIPAPGRSPVDLLAPWRNAGAWGRL